MKRHKHTHHILKAHTIIIVKIISFAVVKVVLCIIVLVNQVLLIIVFFLCARALAFLLFIFVIVFASFCAIFGFISESVQIA